MYDYVASNVRYAYDVDVPVWYVSSTVTLGDRAYVYEVRCVECQNYVQSPELTLRIRQGDCEDQAVLIYAMVKYYMREVYGVEYALYLAYVELGSGSGHMATLMPVQGREGLHNRPRGALPDVSVRQDNVEASSRGAPEVLEPLGVGGRHQVRGAVGRQARREPLRGREGVCRGSRTSLELGFSWSPKT
jgi:hypothetical protein